MCGRPEGYRIDKEIFCQRYTLTEEAFQKSGLEWSLLEQIHARYSQMTTELQSAADYVSGRLQLVPAVHSLKVRIKNAEHLLEKIIRKKSKSPDVSFDCTSFESLITDLIGIRALHLFKDEWREIDKFVKETWDLHEEPLAYVREGDPTVLVQAFQNAGCRVEEHPFGYRSIHYVLKTQPAKCIRFVELQVRTIFEEAWSEIDHRVRYPRQSDNQYLDGFLAIFNRLAGAADEMGTFTKELSTYIREQAEQAGESQRRFQQKEDELKKAVSQLQISTGEKAKLEKQIAELSRSSKNVTLGEFISTGVNKLQRPGSEAIIIKGVSKTCSVCHDSFNSPPWEPISYPDLCPSCKNKTLASGLYIQMKPP